LLRARDASHEDITAIPDIPLKKSLNRALTYAPESGQEIGLTVRGKAGWRPGL